MPPARFETTSELLQTYALDRVATGIGKSKFHPETGHEVEQMYSSTLFFNFDARLDWVVIANSCPLYLRQRPDSHFTGGWVCTRAGVDGCGKSPPPPPMLFDPRAVHPLVSRYTE
jgi:hypothetical protein